MKFEIKGKLKNLEQKIQKQIRIAGGVNVNIDKSAIYDDGTPVELIALYLEFGTKNMPARPFMRSAIKKNKKSWADLLAKSRDFDTVGKKMVEDIKESILDGNFKPLKQSTVNKKGHAHVLIDTGKLYDSIDYKKVKSRKKLWI